jgi:hypothetical protein
MFCCIVKRLCSAGRSMPGKAEMCKSCGNRDAELGELNCLRAIKIITAVVVMCAYIDCL